VRDGIYTTANLGKSYPVEKIVHKSDSLLKGKVDNGAVIDKSFVTAQLGSPSAQMFMIGEDASNAGTVSITAFAKSLHYYNSDSYTFDKYTGKLLSFLPQTKKSAGLKMNEMNYDLHVGQIGGLTTKIIAFLASLICASLPITGIIIWFGKRKKSKSKKVKEVVHRRVHKQHLT
jgi:uncharacterized iron-regulated membrane protein